MTGRGLLPIALPFLAKIPLSSLILLVLTVSLFLYQIFLLPFLSALCHLNARA